MGQHMLPGNPPITLILRRSARARRISLRVSGVDGKVTLTLPQGVPYRAGMDFAETKAAWLRAQLQRQPDLVLVGYGLDLPYEGSSLTISPGPGRAVQISGDRLIVPGKPEQVPRKVQAWLKARARDRLAAASDHFAAKLGRGYARLTLRDTRSRWGSCTHDGGLMYSWRLILAPGDVLDYVAAHEVAHLAQMNHSPAFWAVVQDLLPDYEKPRRWLREHGQALHRFRFENEKD